MKVSFFENIFFWTWDIAETRNQKAAQRGLPWRVAAPEYAGAVIAITQYVYFLFFLFLILHTLNDDTVFALSKINTNFTIVPLAFGFVIWCVIMAVYLYPDKKYFTLIPIYRAFSETKRAELKKRYIIYMIVTAIITVVTIKSIVAYADKVERIVVERTWVFPDSEEDRLQRQRIMQSIINQSEE